MTDLLKIKNLNVNFKTDAGDKHILHDVSLSVQRDQTVCIVGESGSGKSVTVLSTMGLLPNNGRITSGSIQFEGKELTKYSEKDYERIRGNEMSMIFQEPMTALNPVLKIGYQLGEPLKIHRRLEGKAARAEEIKLLKRVGIPEPDKKVDMYPFELSGGQRQRVMIAMALAADPALLIADEPTTALDVTIQAQILALINDLKKQTNMGILFITHDMGVVAQIADYVVVMYHGVIIETGTLDEVFNHPKEAYTKKLLAAVPDVDAKHVNDNVIDLDTHKPILQLNHVTTIYPGKKRFFGKRQPGLTAVNDVSFNLYKGETLGLVGESGSGKSTLGRTVMGLEKKSAGHIFFQGKEVGDIQKRDAKTISQIQMIFQDPYSSLDPRQKIGKALDEVLAMHTSLTKAQRYARVIKLLQEVELDASCYSRYPREFSGGQRQRIGIARAIALNPSLVICDEAVSALDVSIQAEVLKLLKKLQKDLKLTYIFISHDLGVVRDISDRILVMYFGTIVESGTTEQIFNNPLHPYTQQLLAAIPRLHGNTDNSEKILQKHFSLPPKDKLHTVEAEKGHLVVDF